MQAAIGPFLEQVADWSKGSVHVTRRLSLVVSIGVAEPEPDQYMYAKEEFTQCNCFGMVHIVTA